MPPQSLTPTATLSLKHRHGESHSAQPFCCWMCHGSMVRGGGAGLAGADLGGAGRQQHVVAEAGRADPDPGPHGRRGQGLRAAVGDPRPGRAGGSRWAGCRRARPRRRRSGPSRPGRRPAARRGRSSPRPSPTESRSRSSEKRSSQRGVRRLRCRVRAPRGPEADVGLAGDVAARGRRADVPLGQLAAAQVDLLAHLAAQQREVRGVEPGGHAPAGAGWSGPGGAAEA